MNRLMQYLRRLLASFALRGVTAIAAVLSSAFVMPASAQAPAPWQMGMQTPGSPVAAGIQSLHDLVLIIITLITIFVAGLLLYVVWRYSAHRNATPSQTSHNTTLEIAWTVIPVLILVVIAIPSFRLVYFEDRTTAADMTIKVTGHQWFWQYTYPDQGNVDFASRVVPEDQLKPGQTRLLDVDEQLVLPVGKNVRILTTSADVIHSFYIPSLGVQRYAIPGRTIETWVRIDRAGVYYGECNQICGTQHSSMPISIRAVPDAEFQAWVTQAKTKYAVDTVPSQVQFAAVAR
jgi:cytochrome c oxidase subunit 2